MTVVYPTYFTQMKGFVGVQTPDLHITTEGKDLADAISMARDAIGLLCVQMEDEGKPLPGPNSRKIKAENNSKVSLVDVDLTEYRARLENRMIKKNCVIQYKLNKEAEKRGYNFSAILQEAVRAKLQKDKVAL